MFLFHIKPVQTPLLVCSTILHNWFLHLPGVCLRPGAHLLGDIHTLLSGLQLGHQLSHMLAGSLGLQGALFLGRILDNCLCLVITFLFSFLKSTPRRSTDLPWFLGTSSNGSELLYRLLLHCTHLFRPRVCVLS